MKTKILILLFVAISSIIACDDKDENPITTTIDTSKPDGAFIVSKKGNLVAQNGTPTKGLVELGVDSKNVQFLHLGKDFITELGTGTATVYLSKTAMFTASPGTGNPDLKLIGIVSGNGEAFYKINGSVSNDLKFAIIWCGTAAIPFGNTQMN